MNLILPSKNSLPLDSPLTRELPRLYIAITNHCNRTCPWCCTYSSPMLSYHMTSETLTEVLNQLEVLTDIQLEGGEPSAHPDFWQILRQVRSHPKVAKIILNTNGVNMPNDRMELKEYCSQLGTPILIKISYNHYLAENDPDLLHKIRMICDFSLDSSHFDVVINLRRRLGVNHDDEAFRDHLEGYGLLPFTNDFYLQAYGRASKQKKWSMPFSIKTNYEMVNPDGKKFGADLIQRSEHMKRLK